MPSERGILPFTPAFRDLLLCLPPVLKQPKSRNFWKASHLCYFAKVNSQPSLSLWTIYRLVFSMLLELSSSQTVTTEIPTAAFWFAHGIYNATPLSIPLVCGVNTEWKTHFRRMLDQTRCSCSQKGTAGCSRSCCLDHLEYFITFRIRMYKNIKTHQSAHKCGD